MNDLQPPQQPQSDRITDIIKVIADRVEPIIKLWTSVGEGRLKAQKAEARFRAHMSWVAVVVVSLFVLVAGTLTYFGKMDGSTFGFLLGTLFGYMLTFIREWIAPPTE